MASLALKRANWAPTALRKSLSAPASRSQQETFLRSISQSRSITTSPRAFQNNNTSPKPTPPPTTSFPPAPKSPQQPTPPPSPLSVQNISKTGLSDAPAELELDISDPSSNDHVDWTRSYHGLSTEAFSKEAAEILTQEIDPHDVEIKPDGIVYLPEIKYRRVLNKAFGPGGWGLVPRGETIVTPKTVTREYALVAHGRLVSIARGEQDYFSPDGIPTATEGCKSNAMVRCCKDLGVASDLWDPRWIRKYKAEYTREVFVEHMVNKRKSKIWVRKDDPVSYPWKESKGYGAAGSS
ncbi:hypothetical protein AJ80_08500 [Polytolypa hystricis UAMH7299]|uniref:Mitochondrial genome maintenance protein MGM101 n=1 Tax=Polytolypa hystricis (strain UAMH7299) TaxID=1447883 RepID=A0A2B7X6U1_POLH7|nr:hypothetical protein AJ80_08500 [Polytolypa hystricis UAMH7299]